MPFWVWNLLVILWWPSHVKSGLVTQVNGTELPLEEAQSTLTPVEEDPETLEELYSNTTTIIEGDIILQNDRNAVAHTWMSPDIPYEIHSLLRGRRRLIIRAMEMISAKTCVTFHPHTSEIDFLSFEKGHGCASYVGCILGKQPVYIGGNCGLGNVVHEIMHALGFHHEHTRMDRDEHIEIQTQNIIKKKLKNFKKQRGSTYGVDYDVESIMHYGSKSFSSNGKPTIKARDSSKRMGQRKRITDRDALKMRSAYMCA